MHEGILLALVGSLLYSIKSWLEKIAEFFVSSVLFTIESRQPHVRRGLSKIKSWSKLDYRWDDTEPQLAEGTHILWSPIPIVIIVKTTETYRITLSTFILFRPKLEKFYQRLCNAPSHQYLYGVINEQKFRHLFRNIRDPRSLVLRPKLWEELVEDIQTFSSRRKELHDKGLDAKRSFLFYGPPGTGKTSLVQTLAGHFGYTLSNCKTPKFKDLTTALMSQYNLNDTILLFDDVDELTKAEDFDLGQFISLLDNLPLSGLVIFTCNDPSCLPPKLMRVGRIDRKIKIDYATQDQIQQMFTYFYPNAGRKAAADFACACHGPVAPAVIQEFLMRNTYRDAIRYIGSYLKDLENERKELTKQY